MIRKCRRFVTVQNCLCVVCICLVYWSYARCKAVATRYKTLGTGDSTVDTGDRTPNTGHKTLSTGVKTQQTEANRTSGKQPGPKPVTNNTHTPDTPWNCTNCFQWSYRVLLNQPEICRTHDRNQTIELVFLIPTAHVERVRRDAIRRTWASVTRNNTASFRHVFVLGVSMDPQRMRDAQEEARHFRDVVVMDFLDTYRNLTLKTVTSLRWLTETCSQARFFLKVDDDMWVNVDALLSGLRGLGDTLLTATAGRCTMSSRIIRDPSNKWSVTYKEYPLNKYPKYCSGTAYAGTVHLARQVVSVSPHIPFFSMEDVFVGLCLRQLGYSVKNVKGFHMTHQTFVDQDRCSVWTARVITLHHSSPQALHTYWNSRSRCTSTAVQDPGP